MKVFKMHTLYKPSDFTDEEIERKNILAVMVIDENRLICKKCGKSDAELNGKCISKSIERKK